MGICRTRFSLMILLLFIHTHIINALPPRLAEPASPALRQFANATRLGFLTKELSYFPPGPPEPHYLHPIIDTDFAIQFYPLGRIPRRNESLVQEVLRSALYDALRSRQQARIPGQGYKQQIREFLLSVHHSVGTADLTWGNWVMVLGELQGYTGAYPGWDFQFGVRKYQGWEIEGHVIGAGFCETRV